MIGVFTRDMNPQDIKETLQHNAEKVTEGEYYRTLTDEEIEARRHRHTETCIKVKDLESKKKLAVEHFKGKIKPLMEDNAIVLEQIKTRQVKAEGILYEVANYDDSVMETYNQDGEFISYRKLRADERNGGSNVFALPLAK
jgi:hypothetical protein